MKRKLGGGDAAYIKEYSANNSNQVDQKHKTSWLSTFQKLTKAFREVLMAEGGENPRRTTWRPHGKETKKAKCGQKHRKSWVPKDLKLVQDAG